MKRWCLLPVSNLVKIGLLHVVMGRPYEHPRCIRPTLAEENGELEMSCPRCGGVLPDELADAMAQLVCGMFVIEGRHCHCDDIEDPVQSTMPPEGRVAFTRESPEITSPEAGTR